MQTKCKATTRLLWFQVKVSQVVICCCWLMCNFDNTILMPSSCFPTCLLPQPFPQMFPQHLSCPFSCRSLSPLSCSLTHPTGIYSGYAQHICLLHSLYPLYPPSLIPYVLSLVHSAPWPGIGGTHSGWVQGICAACCTCFAHNTNYTSWYISCTNYPNCTHHTCLTPCPHYYHTHCCWTLAYHLPSYCGNTWTLPWMVCHQAWCVSLSNPHTAELVVGLMFLFVYHRVSVAPISVGGSMQQWIQDCRWIPSPGPVQFLGPLLKTIHALNMQLKWTSSFWLLLPAHLARSHCTWVLRALCEPPPARCVICMVHEGKWVASCVQRPLGIRAHQARVWHFAVLLW